MEILRIKVESGTQQIFTEDARSILKQKCASLDYTIRICLTKVSEPSCSLAIMLTGQRGSLQPFTSAKVTETFNPAGAKSEAVA